MNRSNQHFGVLFIAAFVILVILAIALSSFSQIAKTVSAVEPPTPIPAFEGESFTAVIDTTQLNQTPINFSVSTGEWTTVISETFESGFPSGWSSIDDSSSDGGEYRWDLETFSPSPTVGDSISAWAVGGGLQGGSFDITNPDGYPDNVDSWLIYGPLDLSGVGDISLTFDYWLQTDGGDALAVAVSTSSAATANFSGEQVYTTTSGWTSASYDLSDELGESTVYIGFNFTSDASGNSGNLPGALLDNVIIQTQGLDDIYLPLVIKDPTPTPNPTPAGGEDYKNYFTNESDIEDWEKRRGDTSESEYEIYHGDSGVLNVQVKPLEDYLIVSPLVAAPSIPYTVEISAQHKEAEHRDLLGIVFGGDWNGDTCDDGNNTDPSTCFNSHYTLKVEYREKDGETFLRYKLLRVNEYVANQPSDVDVLIDWEKVSTDENDYNEWRVEIQEDNDIKIYLNDNHVDTYRDNDMDSFIEPYFGVIVETKDQHDDFRGKFDYIEVIGQ